MQKKQSWEKIRKNNAYGYTYDIYIVCEETDSKT